MYKLHTKCRACGFGDGQALTKVSIRDSLTSSQSLIPVAEFGLRPLANDFKSASKEREGFAPLEVLYCPICKLGQLSVVVNPSILYRDYPYVTSNTTTMQKHFAQILPEMTLACQKLPASVLEIGSNDGKFLRFCLDCGVKEVMGVEPDMALATKAVESGVLTSTGFWPNVTLANTRYDLIVARHVFAHVDDWHGFIKGCAALMDENSILWIECPYVMDMLRSGEADTIYHEHLSYVGLGSVTHLLSKTDLYLSDVHQYPLHGGSIGMVIRKTNPKLPQVYSSNMIHLLDSEKELNPEKWKQFALRSDEIAECLMDKVFELGDTGAKVCGYGAPAKSSFWIQQCQFSRQDIAFITDDTPAKQYTFSPGTNIPIVDEGALLREMPDYAILFCWNFEQEVMQRQKKYIEAGGRFIVPVPEVRIVP